MAETTPQNALQEPFDVLSRLGLEIRKCDPAAAYSSLPPRIRDALDRLISSVTCADFRDET